MTETKSALITGITGQDGSHLADLLVEKGYDVFGLVRRHANPNYVNIQHQLDDHAVRLIVGDMSDQLSLAEVIREARPDEVYNLAAQSHVGVSFKQPTYTVDVTGLGALRLLEAVRQERSMVRVYQASSSEMFGLYGNRKKPLQASDPMVPASPYGAAKLLAHSLAGLYREAHGLHVCCGILFNHEGERRGDAFVTRKITRAVARIQAGKQDMLHLGTLTAVRDWGYAPEYMDGVWRMLQASEPCTLVLATGEGHTVGEWLETAWAHAGISTPMSEVVVSIPAGERPLDIKQLVGDPSAAKEVIGWEARTRFSDLVRIMVEHDMRQVFEEASE